VAVVAPAATVTEVGTVNRALLLDSATVVKVEMTPLPKLVIAQPMELRTGIAVNVKLIC
jgi:hypothetical protein